MKQAANCKEVKCNKILTLGIVKWE